MHKVEKLIPARCLNQETYLVELSLNGARIVTQGTLPETSLPVYIELAPKECVAVNCRPIWQQPVNRAGQHIVALRFDDDQTEVDRLRDWMARQ